MIITTGDHIAILPFLKDDEILLRNTEEEPSQIIQRIEMINQIFGKNFKVINDFNFIKTKKIIALESDNTDILLKAKALGIQTFSGNELEYYEHHREMFFLQLEKNNITTPHTEIALNKTEALHLLNFIKSQKVVIKAKKTKILPREIARKYIQEEINEFPVILQEFIEGYEISCEIYFNKTNTITHNFTIETKYTEEENLGRIIGCASNIILPPLKQLQKIYEKTCEIIFSLNEHTHGIADVNFIIKDDKLYPLEITPRVGYLGTISFAFTTNYQELINATLNNEPFPETKEFCFALAIHNSEEITVPILEIIKMTESKDVKIIPETTETIKQSEFVMSIHAKDKNPLTAIEKCTKTLMNLKEVIPTIYARLPDQHLIDRISYFLVNYY
ncbi:MAG: ATP-grasp domain-containing protein [bacterium]|nr:ATP-grasp domain-containing protein [bacterium]